MGEGTILQLQTGYWFWIGFAIRPIIINAKKTFELSVYLPFVMLSIQFKKKTDKNSWFEYNK